MDKKLLLAVGVALAAGFAIGRHWPAATPEVAATRPATADAAPKQASSAAPVASPSASSTAASSSAVAPDTGHPVVAQEVAPTGEVPPIDTSPGFEYLAKPASEMKDTNHQWTAWRRHQDLQKQPRDEAWSPQMEAAIRNAIQQSLMAKGVDISRIELSVVECRTGGCEIQATGYTADNMKQGVDLQSIVAEQMLGPWANVFDQDQMMGSLTGGPEGRVLFLVQLPRKDR